MWISRNPKRSAAKRKVGNDTVPKVSSPKSGKKENKSNGIIPSSLNPFLGWTRLSACQIRRSRTKRRRTQNAPSGEPLLSVSGKAIFFIHDPRAIDDDKNNNNDTKSWFQGRFFPSVGLSSNNGSRASPTSVVSDQKQFPITSNSLSSWGLLAVQNTVEDECLHDECGGYRELDVTIIRNKPTTHNWMRSSTSTTDSASSKIRSTIQNIEWTGGDMMRLSTSPYSSSLSADEIGLNFEPNTLMEGDKAMNVATKYFPSLVKRLHIDNLMNENGEESSSSSASDDMIIVGDMTVVAPKSFVRPLNVSLADQEEDGLWND